MKQPSKWSAVGARIRAARELSIDRSAMMRMESGERKVSALELSQLATVLGTLLAERDSIDAKIRELSSTRGRLDHLIEKARAISVPSAGPTSAA